MIPTYFIVLIMLATLIGVGWLITDNQGLGIVCFISLGILTLVALSGGLS